MENSKLPKEISSLFDDVKEDSISLKDIWDQIKIHRVLIGIVTASALVLSIIYAVTATDIYRASTVLKIEQPKGSILSGGVFNEIMNNQNDRYIANEIQLLNSSTIRSFVASSLIDSFKTTDNKGEFSIVVDKDSFDENKTKVYPRNKLKMIVGEEVEIKQLNGLDFIEISVESPSPDEARLIAKVYADVYLEYNLLENRRQVSNVTNFLEAQKREQYRQLTVAEDTLKYFRLMAGVVELGTQATNLIETISNFEAEKNTAEMELEIAKNTLQEYQVQLQKMDPTVSKYLDGKADESYLILLQEQIAQLETQRDLAITKRGPQNKTVLDQYNNQILELKSKLNTHIASLQDKLLSSSPEEVKELMKLVFEQEVIIQAKIASIKQLNKILKDYDSKFSNLPKATLELARLERNKAALEKLYMVLEEKYQEALINEQSIPGNVTIIDKAEQPDLPAKPNRKLIVIVGVVLGFGLCLGFLVIRRLFNTTILTPEDIQNNDIKILGWIPKFNGARVKTDFIVKENPKSIPCESYRAIRTRIQYSNGGLKQNKTILVTSCFPSEGKTTSAVNIAGSFALANKKVLLIDADFRKPRMHKVFGTNKIPGLVDYFNNEVKLDTVFHKTDVENLFFIPAGTIPNNPSELLGSNVFKDFLETMKSKVDLIIIDSAPLLPVTDSELLSKIVDASILVVSSGNTEKNSMIKAVEMLEEGDSIFIGAILNNFGDKYTNSSAYKYYYYYQNKDSLTNEGPSGKPLTKVNINGNGNGKTTKDYIHK